MRGRRSGGVEIRGVASGVCAGFALAILCGTAVRAGATTVLNPAGVEIDDAEIFKPTIDPGPFLSVYDSATIAPGRFTLGFYGDYAREPLAARQRVAGEESKPSLVDNLGTANLLGAIGIAPRFELGFHLPLYLVGESDVRVGFRELGGTEVNFGDLLIAGKVDLLPEFRAARGLGFAVVPLIGLPTGNRREFSGLGEFSYGGLFAADLAYGVWRLGANFGGMIRDGIGDREAGDHFEDQLRWGVAGSAVVAPRTSVIAEVHGLADAGSDDEFRAPVEVLGALRFGVGPVDLTFGAGGGVNSGKNAPLFRFLIGLTSSAVAAGRAAGPDFATSRKSYVVEDWDRNGQVSPGDVIVYTITASNTGSAAAQNVVVIDPIPANTEYQPGTLLGNGQVVSDAQGYAANPSRIEVNVGSLGTTAGANQATVSFKARIRSDLPTVTSVRNQASVRADGAPPFRLPIVDTQVFPATVEREHVVQTPRQVEAREKLQVTQNIQFEPNKATIRPESHPVLDEIVSILNERATLELTILGHTDDVGKPEANLRLSQQRADAVKSYLSSHGIAPSRLQAVGRGAAEPVASNSSESGRAANRRVEFVVTKE